MKKARLISGLCARRYDAHFILICISVKADNFCDPSQAVATIAKAVYCQLDTVNNSASFVRKIF